MAKESTFINMTLTLLLVTAIAGTALGLAYSATKEPIDNAKNKKLEQAIGEVVPAFDELNTFNLKPTDGIDEITCYEAMKEGAMVGTAIKTYTDKGFSGRIWIIAGFTPEGNIINYKVLEHKETPGLGDKMSFWFNDETQPGRCILGKNPATNNLTVSKDGGEVDAITAATISSRAFLDAVQRGHDTYFNNKK